MLTVQHLSYTLPNKDLLFADVNLSVNSHEKVALIGNNGSGKSTLLKIIAKEFQTYEGQFSIGVTPYYIPQVFGQFNHQTIAQALRVEDKLNALHRILNGDTSEDWFTILNDDWTIEDRCKEALTHWGLGELDLNRSLQSLSGGQKTKVFLAGIAIHESKMVLLDEPSNHLDLSGREMLYDFISTTNSTLIIVSHDRKLLNLLDSVCELSRSGLKRYGGNYDFYVEQKQIEKKALSLDIQSKEKALRKAKEKERETVERQQKLDSRGKGKQEKAGVSRIMMNTLRNKAENSTSKLKSVHAEKIGGISQDLKSLRETVPGIDKMTFGFDNSQLHKGKILFSATDINFNYGTKPIWKSNLKFQITSGERIAIKGKNGSGKTTLINLILGVLATSSGTVYHAENKSVYIDQEYSLIDNSMNVYDQAQQFNESSLQEHQIKSRLNRFLFTKEDWIKPCRALSGGERMRLLLCGITVYSSSPDIIILDEPTNNLDIQNIEILTAAINEYEGTLIVVSHDETFLEQIKIEREISLL
ncbi:ATPase subunit of ABC transporter with duplicated ATPase domains [Algoriphagus iocasae]|uniref:ATPase subunit of ABC transporter with duplicated ATPase domains n=1 Tax=Algoriphagus iocasae TaxID=1836499 RepID=A0A841MY95_9BACT|nr:ABC-F family ATP-binding cassette domain-containing protein [Algoriphagus iocasae]MBB6329006.1 ATPase subunit of ABC transporter with duplicated ATPase domains [Algoriphagus iocasae]